MLKKKTLFLCVDTKVTGLKCITLQIKQNAVHVHANENELCVTLNCEYAVNRIKRYEYKF